MAQPKLLAHPQTSTAAETPKRKITKEAFDPNAFSSTTTKSLPPTPPSGEILSPNSLGKAKTPKATFAAIDQLRKDLPEIPYLITLQPGCPPFPGKGRYEDHRGSPFETWEYERYQYMSFISCEGLEDGAVLNDRELLNSLGDWREASRREEKKYHKWREEEERRREVEGKVREMESGRSTPWGSQGKPTVATGTGSGGNTERKKVNFADYLKKKKTSPSDTPARMANGVVPQVRVNGVVPPITHTSKSQESEADGAILNHPSLKSEPMATSKRIDEETVKNGAPQRPQNAQGKPPALEKEEGELADEPSLPSSIANILKAPIGREPLRQPSVPPQPPRESHEKPPNKRPVEKGADDKRQKVEAKSEAPKQPYIGSARPAGHHRAASGNIFDRLSGRNSKSSTPLPQKRDDDRRKSVDRGATSKNGMPRLLSPLPGMQSTPMQKTDSQQSRRGDVSPPRSQPMRKDNSKDSERGRDRSPSRSQPMWKENCRDSHRGDERRRSRSPMRSEPMKKDTSRNSARDSSPRRDERKRSKSPRRDRSPPRSQSMKKENIRDDRDLRRDSSPVKKDPPAVSKPQLGIFGGKTISTVAKKEPTRELKKEPLPMPAMLSFDLPTVVKNDMKRRLDAGELAVDVAAAFVKAMGHKRNASNVSNGSQTTAVTNGSTKREREETPVTETERTVKKTSTQAARERARKGDTPGVARKAVAPKAKAKVESKVVKLRFHENSAISDKIALILKTKSEKNHVLSDYQSHRGRNMVNRRTEAVKSAEKAAEKSTNKRARPSQDDEEEDEDQSPVQRKRQQPKPSTPRDRNSGFGAESLVPPSVSKVKQNITMDKAGTPGAAAGTPTQQPVSPTAVRSTPSTHALTDVQKAEVKKLRAEYDRFISLGTSLKRQRDALIRPSPDSGSSRTVSEAEAKKANIMGVESLLAYLVGFEALDRAYRTEGTRNRGQHWKSLFPYLDSYRAGIKASTTDDKSKVVLDIVATLVGYTGASCLANLLNSVLEKDGVPNSREAMQEFIKEQTGNFKRREFMGQTYQNKCQEVARRWPEMLDEGRKLAWVKTAGGQFGSVDVVKTKLDSIVKELCSTNKVDWQSKLDF